VNVAPPNARPTAPIGRCALVGAGRMGRALVAALPWLEGPFGRGFDGAEFEVVLLAVPDGEIGAAAATVRPGRLVGHCAGSLGLHVLGDHEAFAVHPLMTVTHQGATFAGAGAAIAGSTARALATARHFAEELGMQAFQIADADRFAYHAAASIAANFLITLEDAAESMMRTAGADRSFLVPLVRAALDNWAMVGAPAALTGPIVRGDEATVQRQRAAVGERMPELLDLFDVLCDRTREIAARPG
jgi:predicted short-subunit dehydrogenase-like oxidoreductase (DUF2520 family)